MNPILVVYWWPPSQTMRHAVESHLRALDKSGERVVYVNAAKRSPLWSRMLDPRAVILHTTFLCARWYEDFATYRKRFAWLAGLECPKIALPQDEYDHAHVLDEWLAEMGVRVVASNFDSRPRNILYPKLADDASFLEVLTGYIDGDGAAYCGPRATALSTRSMGIVYRAQKLPYWFGSHGQLKHLIAEAVIERAPAHGLDVDISIRPEDTIFGQGWLDFLMSGRTVIGVESGSSVLDRRGEMQARIRDLVNREPNLTFAQVDAQMPKGWDSYSFFAISPRHLEAVVARTSQVLVEGDYSGVLRPEEHYIPIRRDLMDLDGVLERLQDVDALQQLADRAYDDVFGSGLWTIERFAKTLLGAMPAARKRAGRTVLNAVALKAGPATERRFDRWESRPRRRLLHARASALGRSLRVAIHEPALLAVPGMALRRIEGRDVRNVARDLGRITLLLDFVWCQRRTGGPWRVNAERVGDVLHLRSQTRPGEGSPNPDGVRRIIWDHSAAGGDRYEFHGFASLAERGVSLSWPKIVLRELDA